MKLSFSLRNSIAKGIAFVLGIFATGLFAITVNGVINSFAPGGPVYSSKINKNFQSLQPDIENVPVQQICDQVLIPNKLPGGISSKPLIRTANNYQKSHLCTDHEFKIVIQTNY